MRIDYQGSHTWTLALFKYKYEFKFIKLVIALGKGKKRHDKRETIKRREQERDARGILKRL